MSKTTTNPAAAAEHPEFTDLLDALSGIDSLTTRYAEIQAANIAALRAGDTCPVCHRPISSIKGDPIWGPTIVHADGECTEIRSSSPGWTINDIHLVIESRGVATVSRGNRRVLAGWSADGRTTLVLRDDAVNVWSGPLYN